MSSFRAPKQWSLTTDENVNSYESWRQNLLYIFSLDVNFAPFLKDGYTWSKLTASNPCRGFKDDDEKVENGKTAVQKNAHLSMMLGQIANFCPVISRNSIVKNSISLSEIWQRIRQHFGFQLAGSQVLDLAGIKLEISEKPEDLYQRLMAFVEDNLLTSQSCIKHHGVQIKIDEDLSPSLENIIIVIWLRLLHPGLPGLIKQKYGAELRNNTLASIKPEISQALQSLLDELKVLEETKVFRAYATNEYKSKDFSYTKSQRNKKSFKSCSICKAAGRSSYSTHNLNECSFLSPYERKFFARSRNVAVDSESEKEECENHTEMEFSEDCSNKCSGSCNNVKSSDIHSSSVKRVNIIQSPTFTAFYNHIPVKIILDTGSTTNLIKASYAKSVNMPIKPASQTARQADGVTPLSVIGEVHCQLNRGKNNLVLSALVVEALDEDILCGTPFMDSNDVSTRPALKQIIIHSNSDCDDEVIYYGKNNISNGQHITRRTQSFVVRGPKVNTVVLPGEFLELKTPEGSGVDELWALEPRMEATNDKNFEWPPVQEVQSVGNCIRVLNKSQKVISVGKHDHLCQIRSVVNVEEIKNSNCNTKLHESIKQMKKPDNFNFSSLVPVDPDSILSENMKQKFIELNNSYDGVFNPEISRYNGASGKIEGVVNMGNSLPPQRKGKLPSYNQEKLNELQHKIDELEKIGVLAKPENLGITVEYLNMTFLVVKPDKTLRLVTAFTEVGAYSKPQPSLMPRLDSILHRLGQWKFIIVTDLTQAYFQVPLARSSMKYCGIASPFKGIRVYTRCAMGMPGSETCLEELMCRILGDLIQEGNVTKIADNLFCGGNTPEELLDIWGKILKRLFENNLRLKASKTLIAPKETETLGWIWNSGTLRASPHRINALSKVSRPSTVKALRSFIGAYKVLSRVVQGYANVLVPLEAEVAGRQSNESINWSDILCDCFARSQKTLLDNKTIVIPQPSDTLWIVTDGAVKSSGVGATLYVIRNGKAMLGGFFNAKFKKHQLSWLPCEVEALGITAAIKHYSPFIIESHNTTLVMSDSRACVMAYKKLLRGEYSSSARVATFLSSIARYQIKVSHISGCKNLVSDYQSRHPIECYEQSCQICKYINEIGDSVVRNISVEEVLQGAYPMPYNNPPAWLATQMECPDLRKVQAHLKQGTRPSKKCTTMKDVKKYLAISRISRNGTLVIEGENPVVYNKERIIVPRNVIDGFLTVLHIKFCHPSKYQLKKLFCRYFYALDIDKSLDAITNGCHQCCSLKSLPNYMVPQSSSEPPKVIGSSYATDVMRHHKQLILIVRETVSSYTMSTIIKSEKADDIREGLIILCSSVTFFDGSIYVRADCGPGLKTLCGDKKLLQLGINIILGEEKNKNKNAVAEKAVEELNLELLKVSPEGGPYSVEILARATANLNSRLRRDNFSAREIWTQRSQVSGEQLVINDAKIIESQDKSRNDNHLFSSKAKATFKKFVNVDKINIGDIVYVKSERSKYHAREKYIVVSISDSHCLIRKFTSNQFRSKVYKVPFGDCFKATTKSNYVPKAKDVKDDSSDSDYMDCEESSKDISISKDTSIRSDNNQSATVLIKDQNNVGTDNTSGVAIKFNNLSDAIPDDNSVNINQEPSSNGHVLRRSSRSNLGQPPSRYNMVDYTNLSEEEEEE